MDPRERLRRLRHVALDLDGTLYKDGAPFDCTKRFLRRLRELGIGRTFVTNNSARSTGEYVELLHDVGIDAEPDDVYSSTLATLAYLKRELPRVRRLFVLGTESLEGELRTGGYEIAGADPDDPPDAVVVGYDTGLTFERLNRAAYWIATGREFVATHPDRVCPTRRRTVLVDCGSICAALREATGRRPTAVPGKPSPFMLAGIMERTGVRADELAMVGDRLYTDVAMAKSAGSLAVLVLTGETTAEAAAESPDRPDLTLRDVGELGEMLLEIRRSKS